MNGSQASICVVGSFMLDVVMRVVRRPGRGETVQALDAGLFLGGKGFNQAVVARRMGARVAMVGRVGADPFGEQFFAALAAEGIDANCVIADADHGTGIATPLVEADGSNSIVISPRANLRLTPADVERAADRIRAADVLLLQLEVPVEASEAAARVAREAGVCVVLNPAPALPVPDRLLRAVDAVTPNEVEAAALSGLPVGDPTTAIAAAETIRARGVPSVVITLGERGAVLVDRSGSFRIAAHDLAVADTTAAGDAFTGTFAVRWAETRDPLNALTWANAAGGLAVTRLGALPSLPGRDDVSALVFSGRAVPRRETVVVQ